MWPTPIGGEDIAGLHGDVRAAANQKQQQLRRHGCPAADYRLSGADVEHICIVKLPRKHRMVVAFPSDEEVVILLVGPHDDTNPEVDVYARLYEALGIEIPTDRRRKPPCCADGQPPVDAELVDNFLEGSKTLRTGRARRKRGR